MSESGDSNSIIDPVAFVGDRGSDRVTGRHKHRDRIAAITVDAEFESVVTLRTRLLSSATPAINGA